MSNKSFTGNDGKQYYYTVNTGEVTKKDTLNENSLSKVAINDSEQVPAKDSVPSKALRESWLHMALLAWKNGDISMIELKKVITKAQLDLIDKIESELPKERSVEFKGRIDGMGYLPRMENTEAHAQANVGYNAATEQVRATLNKIRKELE